MTTMTDVLDAAVRTARWAKEQSAAAGVRNMLTAVIVYRGTQLIAVLDLPSNRDDMLAVAEVAAWGYEADVIALVMETWHATEINNPLTGEQWGAGEMQDAADNHDGVAKGWLQDAVLAMVANRAGDQMQELMPYEMAGRKVRWLELPDRVPARIDGSDEKIILNGHIPDAMHDIMNRPTASVHARQKGLDVSGAEFGLSAERTTAHRDCAITKILLNPPPQWRASGLPTDLGIVMGAKAGSVRDQVISESMPNVRRIRRDW